MNGLRNLGKVSGGSKGPWERQFLLWIITGVVGATLVIIAAYYFDAATESDKFCGLLCHPNRPEYVTHEVSDHAQVECGTCHIGPGLASKVTAKIFGAEELFKLVTNTYERPIAPPVERLRPARVVCEQCHWPQRFYGDRVRRIIHFSADDEENSERQTYLIMRTGGGSIRRGQGRGIHWHIENPVWYVALDPQRQDIPWVGAMEDGQLVEYRATDSPLTAAELARMPRREMDCMDCHNRATHQFRKPERSVDEAMANNLIDRSLPYVKREAERLLSASYPTQESGLKAMAGLEEFYRTEYPDVYTAKQEAIAQAVETLQDIYRHTVFPEMNLTWQAYANNIGHTDFAGCFRCHDGKHLNKQGDSIQLNCNICHSIPVVTTPEQKPDLVPIFNFITQAESEPSSHRETNFIRDHRFQANESCASCHGPIQFGTDNSSFCANQACHGQTWPEADLNAAFPHPVKLEGKHAQAWCNECHKGVKRPPREDCAACHQPPSKPHFGSECSQCHTPQSWKESAASWLTDVPAIPHRTENAANCLLCHSVGGGEPVPTTHRGIPGESCVQCHHEAPTVAEGAPTIPHLLEGLGNCLACHGEGKVKPAPADHRGWINESCLLCHKGTSAQESENR